MKVNLHYTFVVKDSSAYIDYTLYRLVSLYLAIVNLYLRLSNSERETKIGNIIKTECGMGKRWTRIKRLAIL